MAQRRGRRGRGLRGHANGRGPRALRCQYQRRNFRHTGRGGGGIIFRHGATQVEARQSGGHDKAAVGADQRPAECLNCVPVCLAGGLIFGEIVVMDQMDNAIRSRRATPQAVEVVERTSVNFRTSGNQRLGRCPGAGEAEHFVASAE